MLHADGSGNHPAANGEREDRILFWALGAFLCIVIAFGGQNIASGWRAVLILAPAILLLGFTIMAGGPSRLREAPPVARLVLALIVIYPIVQLLPLPPLLWHALPGREVERNVILAIGADRDWLPLSISFIATLQAILALVPPLAVMMGVWLLNDRQVDRVFLLIAILAAVSVLIGIVQVASAGRLADFYDSLHKGLLLGFFANRNHAALFLVIVMLICAHAARRYSRSRMQGAMLLGALWFLLLCAVIGTMSRSGLALASLAMLFSIGAGWVPGVRVSWRILLLGLAGVAGLFFLLQSSQLFVDVLKRYDAVEEDLRWRFWVDSLPLLRDYLPFGSGLGTFPLLFERYETLDALFPKRVNNAHNDYLELTVDTGLAGVVVIVGFIAALVVRVARLGDDPMVRDRALLGLGIILLFLLHSIVDYPLRMEALAALFGLAVALFFKEGRGGSSSARLPRGAA